VGRGMIKQALVALDEEWWEPWFQQYMQDHGLTYADLVAAATPLAQALNDIIAAKDPVAALEEHGFTKLPPPVQAAYYMKMGQVLLAGIWASVKDVSQPDTAPPADLHNIHEWAYQALERFNKHRPDNFDDDNS